jgi:hypothetical protein
MVATERHGPLVVSSPECLNSMAAAGRPLHAHHSPSSPLESCPSPKNGLLRSGSSQPGRSRHPHFSRALSVNVKRSVGNHVKIPQAARENPSGSVLRMAAVPSHVNRQEHPKKVTAFLLARWSIDGKHSPRLASIATERSCWCWRWACFARCCYLLAAEFGRFCGGSSRGWDGRRHESILRGSHRYPCLKGGFCKVLARAVARWAGVLVDTDLVSAQAGPWV